MSFATPAEFLLRYDERTVGDLLNDDGTTATPAQILTNDKMQTALNGACGEIMAACCSNQHYTLDQLTILANSGLPSAYLLKDIECAGALPRLLGRRFYNSDESRKKIPDYEWWLEFLEKLKNGIRVFELPTTNVQAGVMRTQALGSGIAAQTGGPGLVGHNARAFGVTPVNWNDPW